MEENQVQNIQFLAQVIEAMNDTYKKLEEAYENKDIEKFEESKKNILEFQKKISEIAR